MTSLTSISFFCFSTELKRIGRIISAISVLILISFLEVYAQSDTVQKKYNVLYDTLSENTLVESIGQIGGKQLLSTPSAFISTGLTGRIAGLYTHQSSGEPGNNGASLSLRGRSPLVLVDGIPRSFSSINPEEIKSITVLKDALSTAMLGIRGGEGAILINTKKGLNKKALHLSIKAQKGVSSPLDLPDPLSAYDYAVSYNDALKNDGRKPVYSYSDLMAYKKESDPYRHPNTNWYNKILKGQAPMSRYTLDAEGANEAVKYFVSLDYFKQKGLFKDYGVNTYNTNTQYQRYLFRSNVDVHLAKNLSMSLNIFGRIENQNEPGPGTGNMMSSLLTTPNNAYPVMNPDSSLGGNLNYQNNLYGQLVHSGYHKYINRDGYADLSLKRKMDDILKGWWIKGTLSYILGLNQHINRSKNFETFQMQIAQTGDTSYQRYGTKSDQKNSSSVTARNHEIYAALYTGYSHHWGNNSIDALLMYNVNSYTNNSTLSNKFKTLAGKVKYDFKNRYFINLAASYSGNNRHPSEGRYGFFPAVGVAWNMGNESFFNKKGFVNRLKLRATYGLTGQTVTGNYSNGYYQYIDRWGSASGYHFGSGFASASGMAQVHTSDAHTWGKALKLDVGLDMGFSKNRGNITVDYYRNKLTDWVRNRGKNSALLGWGNAISENIGKYLYSGLEISAGWSSKNQRPKAFNYSISGNISFSDSKDLFIDEPDYPYSWMQRTGLPRGQTFGYVADGFITTAGEGQVIRGYQSVPGDIKYKDLNGDGVINQFDQKDISNQKPLVFYGVNFGFSWNNFHLSLLFQGVGNRNLFLTGNQEWAFKREGKGQAYYFQTKKHWTPSIGTDATHPRLTIGKNPNNDVVSTFWRYSGSYVRLKNAALSYSFKDIHLGGKVKIHNIRLFVNGLNLWTISSLKQSDPEVLLGNYPIQRTINGGVFVQF